MQYFKTDCQHKIFSWEIDFPFFRCMFFLRKLCFPNTSTFLYKNVIPMTYPHFNIVLPTPDIFLIDWLYFFSMYITVWVVFLANILPIVNFHCSWYMYFLRTIFFAFIFSRRSYAKTSALSKWDYCKCSRKEARVEKTPRYLPEYKTWKWRISEHSPKR